MAHGTNREYLLSVDLGYDFSTWGNQKDTRNTYHVVLTFHDLMI